MKAILFSCFCFIAVCVQAQIPAGDGEGYFCSLCNDACDTLLFTKPGFCTHCRMKLVRQTYAERRDLLNQLEHKMTICFYLQDGVEVLDFAGPMEVFNYAGFNVFTVSRTKAPINSQGILKVMPDYSIDDAPAADIIAFFGGNAGPSSNDPEVLKWVQTRAAKTQYFFSVCTGAFILGRAGLLDNLTATTFHSSIESLRAALPKTKVLENVRYVDNGHVITTAGISAGIDGALHLVSRLKGDEMARKVAKYMEYDKWIPNQGLVVNKN
ncbi:MAG TPA: DJ-1/PfpI family protein [Puia sp.]|uniref:DJ-1/PfpI family protein n=1 Tax=Puia sp. TaxID=2045100 RepID=UPI002CA2BAB7|nr:DJ-1/PfpI family protein [Puia sp.]HVU98255.1 DJ-1/PfpI family protein [Puia sp.]